MPIPSHCASCVESARIVQRSLGEVGIVVTFKKVAGMRAAIRHSSRFDLLDLRSDLPYPDPASFLGQVIETVPAGWVPKDVSARVREVMASAGDQRFAAAESLADRLERGSATLIGYGTPQTPQFLVPRIGCRVFLPVDDGVDLAHLCPVRR
jgi:hypothetical protein